MKTRARLAMPRVFALGATFEPTGKRKKSYSLSIHSPGSDILESKRALEDIG